MEYIKKLRMLCSQHYNRHRAIYDSLYRYMIGFVGFLISVKLVYFFIFDFHLADMTKSIDRFVEKFKPVNTQVVLKPVESKLEKVSLRSYYKQAISISLENTQINGFPAACLQSYGSIVNMDLDSVIVKSKKFFIEDRIKCRKIEKKILPIFISSALDECFPQVRLNNCGQLIGVYRAGLIDFFIDKKLIASPNLQAIANSLFFNLYMIDKDITKVRLAKTVAYSDLLLRNNPKLTSLIYPKSYAYFFLYKVFGIPLNQDFIETIKAGEKKNDFKVAELAMMSKISFLKGDFEKIKAYSIGYIKENLDTPLAAIGLYSLAEVYYEEGQREQAYNLVKVALQHVPGNKRYLTTLKKFDEAAKKKSKQTSPFNNAIMADIDLSLL